MKKKQCEAQKKTVKTKLCFHIPNSVCAKFAIIFDRRSYYQATKDLDFLEQAVPILNAEYEYWMSNKSIQVAPGAVLNRYYVINSLPRPESYMPDTNLAATVDAPFVPHLYQQIATGAETGWDFSSRWMSGQPDLATLQTTSVVPVDLNCILYKNELTLASFYEILNKPASQQLYLQRAQYRLSAIQKFLWNPDTVQWNDHFLNGSFSGQFYPSNLVPFWAGVYRGMPSSQIWQVLNSVAKIFTFHSGVPASLVNTTQQWDFANGWAPLQYFVISGLNELAQNPDLDQDLRDFSSNMVLQLVSKWLTTNYCGWNTTGYMFEKYDVTLIGSPGGGGEYNVQDGFGWTNGLALHLLQLYGNKFTLGNCKLPTSA